MIAQAPKTRWGGVANGYFWPNRYFRVEQRDGTFWLIDPDGGRFLSKGINTVRFDQDRIQDSNLIPYADACQHKYGSQDAWRSAVAGRLSAWGFNTLGAWSDEAVANAGPLPLAVTPNLDLGMSFGWERKQNFPDVFDPEFDDHIHRRAHKLCAMRSEDKNIIGWFIDNELRWGPDWRGPDELLTLFLNLSAESPGRLATINWLRERYTEYQHFNSIWRTQAQTWQELIALANITPPFLRKPSYQRDVGEEDTANRTDNNRGALAADCDDFAARVAERYFASTAAAIRISDPHHLVLGCRFAYVPPRAVIEAAGRHVDVISFNCYELDPSYAIAAYAAIEKPCMIGEFSFRAADSGLPNTNGAGPRVATQEERAGCFRHYVTVALRNKALVGYHWFEHADQPAEGRFDGENSNFGTVTIDDRVYEKLTGMMISVNAESENIHAGTCPAS